jgi:DNA primase
MPLPDPRDPVVSAERQLLQTVLQFPGAVNAKEFDALEADAFGAPAHRAIHDAIRALGGPSAATTAAAWAGAVADQAPAAVRPLVSELAVAPLPARFDASTGLPDRRYLEELLVKVQEVGLNRQIGEALSTLRRMDSGGADPSQARHLSEQLQTLQRSLAALRSRLG